MLLAKFTIPTSVSKTSRPKCSGRTDHPANTPCGQCSPGGGAFGPHVFHSRDLSLPVQLALLAGRSEIASLEPDYVLKTNAVPNDPMFPQLWGLHNSSTTADISAELAWDVSTGSTANAVGVVDTGIDYTHPDLAANVWTAPTSFTVNL